MRNKASKQHAEEQPWSPRNAAARPNLRSASRLELTITSLRLSALTILEEAHQEHLRGDQSKRQEPASLQRVYERRRGDTRVPDVQTFDSRNRAFERSETSNTRRDQQSTYWSDAPAARNGSVEEVQRAFGRYDHGEYSRVSGQSQWTHYYPDAQHPRRNDAKEQDWGGRYRERNLQHHEHNRESNYHSHIEYTERPGHRENWSGYQSSVQANRDYTYSRSEFGTDHARGGYGGYAQGPGTDRRYGDDGSKFRDERVTYENDRSYHDASGSYEDYGGEYGGGYHDGGGGYDHSGGYYDGGGYDDDGGDDGGGDYDGGDYDEGGDYDDGRDYDGDY